MHPRLFEPALVDSAVRADHRLHLRRAAGRRLPARPAARDGARAQARGLDATRVLDLGIYIIISALVGAKLLLLVTDFQIVHGAIRAELLTLARSGGVFYGGPDPRGRRRARGTSAASACRCGRRAMCSRRASRSATSSAASAASSRAAATASRRRCRGAITFTDPFAAANVGTPLNVPLHPTQLYEAGAELLILALLLGTEQQGQAVRGPDVLALHAALRDLALRHRVLPRRPARHGRRALDVAVHLGHPRAARLVHARLPRTTCGAGARASARARRRRERHVRRCPPDSDGRPARTCFLSSVLAGQSRSQIQRLIKDGHVRVDGREAKPNLAGEGRPGRRGRHSRPDRAEPRPKRCRCPSSTRIAT